MLKRIVYILILFLSGIPNILIAQKEFVLADSLMSKKKYEEARLVYTEILPSLMKNTQSYFYCKNALGRISIFLDSNEQIKETLTEVFNATKDIDSLALEHARANYNFGTYYYPFLKGNNFENSEKYFLAALEIRRKYLPAQHKDVISSLKGLAFLYSNSEKVQLSIKYYLEIIQIYRNTNDQLNEEYASVLNNLGNIYQSFGEHSQAEAMHLEALEIRKELLGEMNVDYAWSLNNLGNLYYKLGLYSEAVPLHKRALEIRRILLGEKHLDYATSLNNLTGIHLAMGNYIEAENYAKESLSIKKSNLGESHVDYINALNNLALLYYKMGNYFKAKEIFESFMPMLDSLGLNHDTYYANYLSNYASILENVNKKAEGLRKYQEALLLYAELVGERHPEYARLLNNTANLLRHMGRFQQAEGYYLKALKVYQEVYGLKHPYYASAIYNLGILYHQQEKLSQASLYYKNAFEIFTEALGKKHTSTQSVIHKQALLNTQLGNYTLASTYFSEIGNWSLDQIKLRFPHLSEVEKERFYDHKIRPYIRDFQSYAVKTSSLNAQLFDMQLTTKALLLNAAAKWKSNIMTSGDKKLVQKFLDWEALKNEIISLYSKENIKRKNLDSLENKANELEKELSRISERFTKLSEQKNVTWKDIQKQLQPNEAAIEVLRINNLGYYQSIIDSTSSTYDISRSYGITDSISYAFLIVTSTCLEPELLLIENGLRMERQVVYYRNCIRFNILDLISYDLLFKPLAEFLAKSKINKLYFSPDGLYHQINLSTLYNPATSSYCSDSWEIHQLTNTKDILSDKRGNEQNKYAVLYGNPDFKGKYKQLEGTFKEVEKIKGLMEGQGWEVDLKIAEQASEQSVKELFKPRILHIASHAYFEPLEERSIDMNEMEENSKLTAANPYWRSGLIMTLPTDSLQKNAQYGNREDGILTAYEAMNLNLDGTSLVVLSACETGLGELKYGEGVYGLQRALMVAGAEAVLISLWKVDDKVTLELMISFYQCLLIDNLEARQAFIKAQNLIRSKYPSPYFWGAFIIVGK